MKEQKKLNDLDMIDHLIFQRNNVLNENEKLLNIIKNLQEEKRELENKNIFLDNFIDYLCDKFDVDREQAEREFRKLLNQE